MSHIDAKLSEIDRVFSVQCKAAQMPRVEAQRRYDAHLQLAPIQDLLIALCPLLHVTPLAETLLIHLHCPLCFPHRDYGLPAAYEKG